MGSPRLKLEYTALLVVDVQEKLTPHMHDSESMVGQVAKLVDAANVLGVPVLVTEQYRQGLGATVAELAGPLTHAACNHEKLKFSACIEPIRKTLARFKRRAVIVCGIEAHVCVLATCLDLLDYGFITAVAVDAIASRRRGDQQVAVSRMVHAGVLPTTVESAILEMVHEAGGDRFKAVFPLIK